MMIERSLQQMLHAALSEPSFQALWSEQQEHRARLHKALGLPSPRNLQSRYVSTTGKKAGSEIATDHGSSGVANCNNICYSTNVELGGQAFPVIIDSGSSDLWVKSAHWPGGYDEQKSTTYQNVESQESDFELTYLDQTKVVGTHGYETLKLGDVVVPHQVFAQVTEIYNNRVLCDEMGVLGLGFSDVSSHNFPALLSNLKASLQYPVFSLYLDEHNDYELRYNQTLEMEVPIPNKPPVAMSSELVFGGVNASRYTGCLEWHDLGQFRQKGETFKGFWDFALDKVTVGQEEILASKLALIDSGSTNVIGSTMAVGQIAKKLSLECFVLTESYPGIEAVECDNPFGFDFSATSCTEPLEPIVFQADGFSYELGTDEMLREVDTALGAVCVFNIMGVPGFPGWLLGMNFMRKYLTVFDFGSKKIGFAEARKCDDTACEEDAYLDINERRTGNNCRSHSSPERRVLFRSSIRECGAHSSPEHRVLFRSSIR